MASQAFCADTVAAKSSSASTDLASPLSLPVQISSSSSRESCGFFAVAPPAARSRSILPCLLSETTPLGGRKMRGKLSFDPSLDNLKEGLSFSPSPWASGSAGSLTGSFQMTPTANFTKKDTGHVSSPSDIASVASASGAVSVSDGGDSDSAVSSDGDSDSESGQLRWDSTCSLHQRRTFWHRLNAFLLAQESQEFQNGKPASLLRTCSTWGVLFRDLSFKSAHRKWQERTEGLSRSAVEEIIGYDSMAEFVKLGLVADAGEGENAEQLSQKKLRWLCRMNDYMTLKEHWQKTVVSGLVAGGAIWMGTPAVVCLGYLYGLCLAYPALADDILGQLLTRENGINLLQFLRVRLSLIVHMAAWMALQAFAAMPQSQISYSGKAVDLAPTLLTALTLALGAGVPYCEYYCRSSRKVRTRGQLYRPLSDKGDFLENFGYVVLLRPFVSSVSDVGTALCGPTSFLFLLLGPFELKKLLLRFLYLHYLIFPAWEGILPLQNSTGHQLMSSSQRRLTESKRYEFSRTAYSLRGTVGRAVDRLQQLGEVVTRSTRREMNPQLRRRTSKGKLKFLGAARHKQESQ